LWADSTGTRTADQRADPWDSSVDSKADSKAHSRADPWAVAKAVLWVYVTVAALADRWECSAWKLAASWAASKAVLWDVSRVDQLVVGLAAALVVSRAASTADLLAALKVGL
jgi:hypothetical protein